MRTDKQTGRHGEANSQSPVAVLRTRVTKAQCGLLDLIGRSTTSPRRSRTKSTDQWSQRNISAALNLHNHCRGNLRFARGRQFCTSDNRKRPVFWTWCHYFVILSKFRPIIPNDDSFTARYTAWWFLRQLVGYMFANSGNEESFIVYKQTANFTLVQKRENSRKKKKLSGWLNRVLGTAPEISGACSDGSWNSRVTCFMNCLMCFTKQNFAARAMRSVC